MFVWAKNLSLRSLRQMLTASSSDWGEFIYVTAKCIGGLLLFMHNFFVSFYAIIETVTSEE